MPKYHVQRSVEIDAPRDEVFDRVADYSTWQIWSPWLIAEPDAKVTVSGDSSSVGSTYAWDGEVVGAGQLTHQKLDSGSHIDDEIRFLRPFKSVNRVTFDFEDSASGGTQVTWNMYASLPFFLFWMIRTMKAMIGMDYERGLKMLKEWVETGRVDSRVEINGIESIQPIRIVGARRVCALKEIGKVMDEAITETRQQLEAAGLPADGNCAAVYHSFNMKSLVMEFSAGYCMPESTPSAPSSLTDWSIPSTRAFHVRHTGPYCHLGNAWSVANQHVRYRKLKQSKAGSFEIYRNTVDEVSEGQLITDIYLPLK